MKNISDLFNQEECPFMSTCADIDKECLSYRHNYLDCDYFRAKVKFEYKKWQRIRKLKKL